MTESVDIEPVATSHDALTALLRDKPWPDQEQIRKRLVVQLGDEGTAYRIFDNAEAQARYEHTVITRQRAELRQALHATETSLRQVDQVLDERRPATRSKPR